MLIKSYVEKNKQILDFSRGKKILHLGCVGFTDFQSEEKIELADKSLHKQLSDVGDCVGIDLDEVTVEELRKDGIFDNVLVGNVEHLADLELCAEEYDVVVAGDIIEHVSNPGLMLDGVKNLLSKEGRLIVSTPNAQGIAGYIRFFRGKFREGDQHVMCFNSINLEQLLERHGYETLLAQTCYQDFAAEKYGGLFRCLKFMLRQFPRFGGTLIYTCRVRE